MRRRRGVDSPGEGSGGALVAGSVLGLDREGVGSLAEGRVGHGTGAGAEGAAIELAEEADTRLGVSEAEAGTGLVGWIGWRRGDCGVGGGVVSMVQVKLAVPLWLPLLSCALTENVWLPWLRPE